MHVRPSLAGSPARRPSGITRSRYTPSCSLTKGLEGLYFKNLNLQRVAASFSLPGGRFFYLVLELCGREKFLRIFRRICGIFLRFNSLP
jgi:hypothetical protein